MNPSELKNPDRDPTAVRPVVIERIADWWKRSLDEAGEPGKVREPADPREIAAKFECSEEEAIRGLSVGEHLYWGGGTDERG